MKEEKGAKVDDMNGYVIRHGNSNKYNVVTSVSVSSLELSPSTEYIVEVMNERGPSGASNVGTFKAKTSANGENITIPTSFIEEHDEILPGQTVNLEFYERLPPQDEAVGISDNSRILGRSEVVADPSVSDGCDARLTCEKASKAISSGGETLKFRNTRTQMEIVSQTHADFAAEKNHISFPQEIRRSIEARPGDLIEIIRPEPRGVNGDREQEELIRETHRMVSEMYEAYLQQVKE